MKKIISSLIVSGIFCCSVLASSANLIDEFQEAVNKVEQHRNDNPVVIKERSRSFKVKELEDKVVVKANKKFVSSYFVNSDVIPFVIEIFQVDSAVPGVLSFGYDVYIVSSSDTSQGSLFYQNLIGTVDITGKNAVLNFNIPVGEFNIFHSIAIDKQGNGQKGLAFISRNLNCTGSISDGFECQFPSSASLDTDVYNFTIRQI